MKLPTEPLKVIRRWMGIYNINLDFGEIVRLAISMRCNPETVIYLTPVEGNCVMYQKDLSFFPQFEKLFSDPTYFQKHIGIILYHPPIPPKGFAKTNTPNQFFFTVNIDDFIEAYNNANQEMP